MTSNMPYTVSWYKAFRKWKVSWMPSKLRNTSSSTLTGFTYSFYWEHTCVLSVAPVLNIYRVSVNTLFMKKSSNRCSVNINEWKDTPGCSPNNSELNETLLVEIVLGVWEPLRRFPNFLPVSRRIYWNPQTGFHSSGSKRSVGKAAMFSLALNQTRRTRSKSTYTTQTCGMFGW